jgi:hypothetical protein
MYSKMEDSYSCVNILMQRCMHPVSLGDANPICSLNNKKAGTVDLAYFFAAHSQYTLLDSLCQYVLASCNL